MMKKSNLTIAFLILCLLSGCGRNTLFSDTKAMPDEKWNMYSPASFNCNVTDTLGSYDVSFSIRTTTDYPYRNLFLFVLTSFPSGTSVTDTIQYALADEKGKWYGKGVGDIREMTMHFKTNVFFPEKGEYHFRVIQGMRDTSLNGVYDFGMKIKKRK